MKKITTILLLLMLGGCYGPRDCARIESNRDKIRQNLFTIGMYQAAFYKEWGLPDQTQSLPRVELNKFLGGTFKMEDGGWRSSGVYEVWIYKSKNVVLVFDDYLLLTGWLTSNRAKEYIESNN